MKSACVVVLGDIGRSPRMCNHAASLAERGVKVSLVGYDGAEPIEAVARNPNVELVHVSPVPKFLGRLPRVAAYALKAIWQALTLLSALPMWSTPDLLLLQNPPSVPTLAVCQFYCKVLTLGRTKLAIDWHNYGYTIMALAQGGRSPLVRLCEWVERTFGRGAAVNFSVTEAMRRDLLGEWGLDNVVTLYDRPPEQFRPMEEEERKEFLLRMEAELGEAFSDMGGKGLLVSSTSWTEDENFGVLLHALDEYESAREADSERLPPLVCAITGKGPMKEYYCQQVILPYIRSMH